MRGWILWILGSVVSLSVGCSTSPPPRNVYVDGITAVRIQFDNKAGAGHSHPIKLSPDVMQYVLSGVKTQRRGSFLPSVLTGEEALIQAFSREEQSFLAPHLTQALEQAKPDELVTFYRRISTSTIGLAITSGGLFVHGPHLYFILANARNLPSEGLSQSIVSEIDPIDSPLIPISRTSFRASFEPITSVVPEDEQWRWPYIDPGRMLVIDLVQLARDSRTKTEPGVP